MEPFLDISVAGDPFIMQDILTSIKMYDHDKIEDKIEKKFIMPMKKPDIVAAWKSHETLSRQAGEKFDQIIEEISYNLTLEKYNVPYYTRIWFSRLKN